ncbi:MAG: Gfo/Idh/MocA family oxidoreductase [Gaiellaceae bacterium]
MKVVCVGAGWVTRTRHLPALAADPRVEILGIVDPSADRAAGAAAAAGLRHSGTSVGESWVAAADAAMIGTPPLAHGPVLDAALERGLHCLCEKPLALPADAAAAAVERARGGDLVLGVVHNIQ